MNERNQIIQFMREFAADFRKNWRDVMHFARVNSFKQYSVNVHDAIYLSRYNSAHTQVCMCLQDLKDLYFWANELRELKNGK